ncbi:MAG TPA: hypothetical protein VNY74_10280 [Edaphobacter sp.]|nr:hypothetical protein [Edaphobacter sp.]
MKPAAVASLAVLLILVSAANAQVGEATGFGSKNTYSAFLEYANDSSHIVLGSSPNRKFASFGLQYERRLLANHAVVWRYAAEFRPLILESDTTQTLTAVVTTPPPSITFVNQPTSVLRCTPGQTTFSGLLFFETISATCSRRWTYAQGLPP